MENAEQTTDQDKMPPHVRAKLDKVLRDLPGMKKEVDDFKRLIELAKSSPLAERNRDFLELQDSKLEKRTSDYEFGKMMADIILKIDKEQTDDKSN